MIADYRFYASTYHGGLTEAEYTSASMKAEAYLRQVTMGRCDAPGLPEKVRLSLQLAACALAEHIRLVEESGYAAGISSQVNDGVSVSFHARSSADIDRDQYSIVSGYLGWTGLLYRGMGGGCCRCDF